MTNKQTHKEFILFAGNLLGDGMSWKTTANIPVLMNYHQTAGDVDLAYFCHSPSPSYPTWGCYCRVGVVTTSNDPRRISFVYRRCCGCCCVVFHDSHQNLSTLCRYDVRLKVDDAFVTALCRALKLVMVDVSRRWRNLNLCRWDRQSERNKQRNKIEIRFSTQSSCTIKIINSLSAKTSYT